MVVPTITTPQVKYGLMRFWVQMPASYVAGGMPIDVSSFLTTSNLNAVIVARGYTTDGSGNHIADGLLYMIDEVGTDTLANKKFRIKAMDPSPATVLLSKTVGSPAAEVAVGTNLSATRVIFILWASP